MDVSLLFRTSIASSFVPSGDNGPGKENISSPNTGRDSPRGGVADPDTPCRTGLRAFAAYANFVPSGDQAPPFT